jgi:hypothetical protein
VKEERLNSAANLIELTLELQKLMAKGSGKKDEERTNYLLNKISELVFEADPTTLEGVQKCLDEIIKQPLVMRK